MKILVFALFCTASFLSGQVDTGTVSGTITDPSGAAIPGATVAIRQLATNVLVQVQTDGSGLYTAPALRPGQYEVSVSQQGFAPQKSQPFDLRVQDRREINFQMQLGSASSEVTVSTEAPALETETSSMGQVVAEKTITDLPLNGRTFIQLATLTAGTLPSARTPERDNFISNGARAIQNSYLLDGIDNKNRIMGFDKSSAQIIQPVIDAIEEFKVQTSTFSAEFGQAAGGVVNVSMKSGTNQVHGNVFEFLRNSHLDATPFFQPAGGGNPLFIQNQYGATLGAPVRKDKTFFFGSWQSSRQGNAAPQIASVPTALQHQGVYPSKVTDPTTATPFPNNTIPISRWDPVANGLFALFPLPNLPGAANNYFYNPKEIVNNDNYNVKIDHHIGNADYLFGRISQGWGTNQLPTLLPSPANQQGFLDLTQKQIMVAETHTFSANKVNEFRFGYVFSHNNQDVYGARLFDQYGIKGALDTARIKGLPTFVITGFSQLGTPTTLGNAPIAASGSGNNPAEKAGRIYQMTDAFTWVHDRQTFKFGIDFSRVTMFVFATNTARPTMTFNGTYTGSASADFLLGYTYQAQTSQMQTDTLQQYVYSGFAQDDWKVSSKLTLNLGVRWELPTPFYEEYNRQSNFVMDAGPCYRQLITVAQIGQCQAGVGRSQVGLDLNNFAPRFGLAYQANAKTVVRGGAGMFYGRDENLGIARRLPNNLPWVSSSTLTGSSSVPAFFLQAGIPANALSLGSTAVGANTTVNSFPFNFPVPYVEQWNLNVERQLAGNFTAQIGYTGSAAKKLATLVNLNQAAPGPGALNSRRPYQGVGNIEFYSPQVNSTYNALVAKLERRFTKGFSLLSSYTYGHSLDGGGNVNDNNDPSPQNINNLRAEKASSNFDVEHRFVASSLYQLPFGSSKGVWNYISRDWQLSGIFSKQGGIPFTVNLSTDPANVGIGSGQGTTQTARPNRIGNGVLPSDQRSVSHWFDATAFVIPTCACFGNSGRGILRGPGFMDLDLGLIRNFSFHERFRIQFRAESFNMMNHPNLGLPDYTIGDAAVGTITSTVNPERQTQLALKFYF